MRTVESGNTENDIFEMKKLNMVSLNLLSLKQNGLDYTMMRRLKNKLYKEVHIKKIVLSDNNLGDKGAKYIQDYFDQNPVLEHLEMNNTGITEVGSLRLIEMFKTCSSLKSISIANNEKVQKVVQITEKRVNLVDETQEIKYI